MSGTMLRIAVLALLLACFTTARAAPPASVAAAYRVDMNGMNVAAIEESYQARDGGYRLVSTTAPHGIFALVKKLAMRFASTGAVTRDGLAPRHFEGQRATGQVPEVTADFDWSAGELRLDNEGNRQTLQLSPGTQDRLSVMYEFMFDAPGAGDTLEVAVTNGRRVDRYVYAITRDVEQDTALGRLKTWHLVKQHEPGEPQNEIWLSPAHAYLPVRMVIVERNGTRYEQNVTRLDLQP